MKSLIQLTPALFLVTACTQETSTSEQQRATEAAIDTASFQAPVVLPAGAFISAMAASDAFEIETAKLALEKARSKAVRDFAQEMIAAHTRSSAELKTAAGQAGQPITPTFNEEQQGNLRVLRGAGEQDFDRLYIDQQVLAHQQALQTLESFAAPATEDPLVAFARKAAPVVRGHLDHARRLDTEQ